MHVIPVPVVEQLAQLLNELALHAGTSFERLVVRDNRELELHVVADSRRSMDLHYQAVACRESARVFAQQLVLVPAHVTGERDPVELLVFVVELEPALRREGLSVGSQERHAEVAYVDVFGIVECILKIYDK